MLAEVCQPVVPRAIPAIGVHRGTVLPRGHFACAVVEGGDGIAVDAVGGRDHVAMGDRVRGAAALRAGGDRYLRAAQVAAVGVEDEPARLGEADIAAAVDAAALVIDAACVGEEAGKIQAGRRIELAAR